MRRPEEVFVFVRRGDQYLVLHRAPRGGSYWHGVAGALEPGEDHPEAARRELEEETGLVADPVPVGRPYAYPIDEEPRYLELVPAGTTEIVVGTFLAEAGILEILQREGQAPGGYRQRRSQLRKAARLAEFGEDRQRPRPPGRPAGREAFERAARARGPAGVSTYSAHGPRSAPGT